MSIFREFNISMIPGKPPLIIHVSQYESDFVYTFNLVSGKSVLAIPTSAIAIIRGTKRDGNGYSVEAALDAENHKVVVMGEVQLTACAGRNVFELAIINDEKVICTANFFLDVECAPLDSDTIQSETVLHDLQAIIEGAKIAAQAAETASAAQETVIGILESGAEEAVDNWLEEHPEATTTVLDGAVTEPKLAPALKSKVIKDYVTPEMFGAVGDGETDDTQALQDMFDSHASRYVFSGNYLVTETVNITQNNANLCGIGANTLQYRPRILAGSANLTLFNVDGFGFSASGIMVEGHEANSILSTTAFYFTGANSTDPLDIDCMFTNCAFVRCDKAVETTGRNAQLVDNVVSQCNTLLHVKYITGRFEYRGYRVAENRFHGCGTKDSTFGKYLIEVDADCNNAMWYMSVLSNMFDKCFGVLKAPLNGVSVIGNSMVEMHGACLFLDNAVSLNNGRRPFNFIGNSVSGFVSPTVNYRLDLAIRLNYSGNSAILSNDFTAMVSCIDIGANAHASIIGNKFYDIWFNSSFPSVPVIENAGEIFAINNVGSNSSITVPPYSIVSTGTAYLQGNKIKSTSGYSVSAGNNGFRSEEYFFENLEPSSTDVSVSVSRVAIFSNLKNCYVFAGSARCYDINFSSTSGLCVFSGATYSASHGIGVIRGSFTINSDLSVTYNKCTVTYDDGTTTQDLTITRFACMIDSYY